jgi:hypothetical protein
MMHRYLRGARRDAFEVILPPVLLPCKLSRGHCVPEEVLLQKEKYQKEMYQ